MVVLVLRKNTENVVAVRQKIPPFKASMFKNKLYHTFLVFRPKGAYLLKIETGISILKNFERLGKTRISSCLNKRFIIFAHYIRGLVESDFGQCLYTIVT